MKRWTRWIEAGDARIRNGRLAEFGLYQIRAVNRNGVPIPIPRIAQVDPAGILYIGRSGFRDKSPARTVANRISEFLNRHHSGGITYDKARRRLVRVPKFSGHRLQVRALFLPDPLISDEEAKVLERYFRKYAELPPCNSSSASRA